MANTNHQSKSKTKRIALTLGILLSGALAPLVIAAPVSALSGQTIISLTNQERQANGLPALAFNSALTASAQSKAADMCAKNYWSHTSPGGLGLAYFIQNAGYSFSTAAENLAKGFSSDSAVVDGWMNSSGHRANILNGSFKDVGVGLKQCELLGVITTVVVAHYGSRIGSTQRATTVKSLPTSQKVKKPTASKPVSTSEKQTKPEVKGAQETAAASTAGAQAQQPRVSLLERLWQTVLVWLFGKRVIV